MSLYNDDDENDTPQYKILSEDEAQHYADAAKQDPEERSNVIHMNFVPPAMPTQHEIQLATLRADIAMLSDRDRTDAEYVTERVRFLIAKYGAIGAAGATAALLEHAVQNPKVY